MTARTFPESGSEVGIGIAFGMGIKIKIKITIKSRLRGSRGKAIDTNFEWFLTLPGAER